MQNNHNVCRFCLKLVRDEDVELIIEVTRKMLALLLIKLDLDVSEDPMICKMCSGILDEIYMFKSKCLYSEDIVSAHFESNLKVNLRDVVMELENKSSVHIAEDEVICRLCIKIPANDNYITLNKTSDKISHCRNMIQIQLPEIDLSFTAEATICETCHTLLKNYVSFATNCANVEQKIKMYCEYQGSDVKEQVDLLGVLQFTENKALDLEDNFSGDLVLKQEDSSVQVKIEKVEDIEGDNPSTVQFTTGSSLQFYIKEEEVLIKSEDDQIRMEICESDHLDDSDIVGKSSSQKKKRIRESESELKTHFCPKCSYSSKYLSAIKRHMRSESHGKLWECCLCPFTTGNRVLLKTHLTSHKGSTNMFACTECPYDTDVYQRLVRHVLKHKDSSEVEMHKCPFCPYKSKSRATLNQHRKMQHGKNVKVYQCKECSWTTKYWTSHVRHQSVHKGQLEDIPKHKCGKCKYETKNKTHLAMHVLTHEARKFKCKECTYQGKRRGDLRRHMMVHSNKTLFSCDQCTYSTHAKEYLVRHKRKNHTGPKVTLQCDQCDFHTKSTCSLYLHKNTHDPTKLKFKCEKCEYSTYLRSSLNKHVVTHMQLGETVVYYCTTCDFKTKYKHSLRIHTKSCLKKKEKNDGDSRVQYQCSQCDFRTVCRTSLCSHKNTHDPTKPKFKCEQCEYSTYLRASLKRHRVTHMDMGETVVYHCATCDFKSKYKNNLRIHMTSCLKKKEKDDNNS